MEYNKLTAQIKACEAEYDKKSQEAKKSYEELIEKYFYSMRDKIVEVVKPLTEEEMMDWLKQAQKDKTIESKLFMLVHVCWRETHEVDEEVEEVPETIKDKDLAVDLMMLGLLRRLL
jgi:secreted Zn-dependent insulinase-like peptidase